MPGSVKNAAILGQCPRKVARARPHPTSGRRPRPRQPRKIIHGELHAAKRILTYYYETTVSFKTVVLRFKRKASHKYNIDRSYAQRLCRAEPLSQPFRLETTAALNRRSPDAHAGAPHWRRDHSRLGRAERHGRRSVPDSAGNMVVPPTPTYPRSSSIRSMRRGIPACPKKEEVIKHYILSESDPKSGNVKLLAGGLPQAFSDAWRLPLHMRPIPVSAVVAQPLDLSSLGGGPASTSPSSAPTAVHSAAPSCRPPFWVHMSSPPPVSASEKGRPKFAKSRP